MLLRGANAVGLHQLSRQRHPGVHQGGRPQRHRRVPGVRLPELDPRHGSGHGRGPEQDKICQATICYTGDILDPKRDKYPLDYYVKLAKELEPPGRPHAVHQGHVRRAEALCRQEAGLHPEAGDRHPHPAPHPRHLRQPGGRLSAGGGGRRGRGGLRHQLHGGHDQPALSQRRGGGPAGHGAGHRPGPGPAAVPDRVLGGRAQAVRLL